MRMYLFACAVFLSAGIAFGEDYKSEGFCASFSKNGIVKRVTWKGKTILTDLHLYGEYVRKDPKQDNRLIQGFDFKGQAVFKSEGKNMTVTTDSILGNKTHPEAARYESVIDMRPDVIAVRTKVTLRTELSAHQGLFYRGVNIPAGLVVNRGVRWFKKDGEEILKTVPPEFRNNFNPGGRVVTFSLPDALLTLDAGKNCRIGFWDSRKWKDSLLCFVFRENQPFSAKPVVYPKGSVFEWNFKISIVKD